MDRAIIFCRTKVDCDKLEMFLESIGTGFNQVALISFILDRISLIAQTKKNSRVFVCMVVCVLTDQGNKTCELRV